MHISLDGYMAGPQREMDWIKFDDDLWDYVGKITDDADTAIYGRTTFQMMESYWPTAAEKPTATKHDIEHARWVNKAQKIVFSRTMEKSHWKGTNFKKEIDHDEIRTLKNTAGKNLLLIGSGSIVHSFMKLDLIDLYCININPVLLGNGLPFFKDLRGRQNLKQVEQKKFSCGVIGFKYEVTRN